MRIAKLTTVLLASLALAACGGGDDAAAPSEAQINAAADSREAVALYAEVSHGTITKRQALRSEALYFVDRLIREHYEAQP